MIVSFPSNWDPADLLHFPKLNFGVRYDYWWEILNHERNNVFKKKKHAFSLGRVKPAHLLPTKKGEMKSKVCIFLFY